MFCPVCGMEKTDDIQVCPKCGLDLSYATPDGAKKRNKTKRTIPLESSVIGWILTLVYFINGIINILNVFSLLSLFLSCAIVVCGILSIR